MKSLRLPACLALTAALFAMIGCAANRVSVAPPVSAEVLGVKTAADLTLAVGTNLTLAQQSLHALHVSGLVTDTEAANINAALQAVAVKNDAAIKATSAADAAGGTGYLGALQAVGAVAATFTPTTFAIKNPSAQATFNGIIAILTASLSAITTNFGSGS